MNDDLAIMDLKDIREYLIECNYNVEAIDYAIKALEKRPQGEWDYEKVAFYGVCSNCGVAVTSNKAEMFLYEEMREFPHNINFCPNCGADMRGKEND